MKTTIPWWQTAIFYQIYPRSFADGNGDGIGDLPGIISKLDYLKDLGIGGLWLSPHFPSPFVDCGYDVADYCAIGPEYGTMADFKRFLSEAHARGIRVVLDLVLNHTSDQHPWFIESRSSKNNSKRDWYIWKEGKNGQPPTNWFSTFGGSAWQFDETTGEYYYHFFFKEQPDLNWNNPAVKSAMFDAVRFWLNMGVDGFRLDAVGTIFEDENYPDQPLKTTLEELYRRQRTIKTPEEQKQLEKDFETVFKFQHDYPGVHDLMKELRKVVDEYDERVLIGETDDVAFYGENNDELHLNFNFPLMRTRHITPRHVLDNQDSRFLQLPAGAWACNTLGNHDSPRMLNSYGDGVHDEAIARVNMMMLLTLKGTPFLYNGEEIGMRDMQILDLESFVDPIGRWYYDMEKSALGSDERTAIQFGAEHSRDKCRTPFQWSSSINAGFSPAGVSPWLPVNPNYQDGVNYEEEYQDPGSFWQYMRSLIHLHNASQALTRGEYIPLREYADQALVFKRVVEGEEILVAINMTDTQTILKNLITQLFAPKILLETGRSKVVEQSDLILGSFSGAIIRTHLSN